MSQHIFLRHHGITIYRVHSEHGILLGDVFATDPEGQQRFHIGDLPHTSDDNVTTTRGKSIIIRRALANGQIPSQPSPHA